MSDISLLYERSPIFGGLFNEWRVKRVSKLIDILGKDWFKDKKVLELGCAFGNIGLYLKSLGSEVTFSDGRQECLNIVKLKDKNAKTILLDQDTDWNLKEKFDLIVHFGISYHLKNWQQDIKNTIDHAQYVAYETAVNKFSNNVDFKVKDFNRDYEYRGSVNKLGSLPSVYAIENVFKDKQITFKRYDDEDLNHDGMIYTNQSNKEFQQENNSIVYLNSFSDPWAYNGRKYWILKK